MNEVEKLLGRKTYELAESQFNNSAVNNAVDVLQRLQELIAAGYINENEVTYQIAKLALQGVVFGDVCMDDVTPTDR